MIVFFVLKEPEETQESGAGREGHADGEREEADGAADDVTAAKAETTGTPS